MRHYILFLLCIVLLFFIFPSKVLAVPKCTNTNNMSVQDFVSDPDACPPNSCYVQVPGGQQAYQCYLPNSTVGTCEFEGPGGLPQGVPVVKTNDCKNPYVPGIDQTNGHCICVDPSSTHVVSQLKLSSGGGDLCDPETGDKVLSNDPKAKGVLTAIGCIPTEPNLFVEKSLKFVAGIAGGIALLMMAMGAIKMILSQGNPDSLKDGQEQFTSAILGLLFVIFSVLLLKIIGVDVLAIPGFG